MSSLTVVCVKEGKKYDHRYVNALCRMLSSFLSEEFHFVCFTENSGQIAEQVEVRNLPEPRSTGWWNKCLLFKPGLLSGRVLYLDLDMIVVNDLAPYLKGDSELLVLENSFLLNGVVHRRINTSMMYWNADNLHASKIHDTYVSRKADYDSDAYLAWPSTRDIGDQQVVLDSGVKFDFFKSDRIEYFKYIQDMGDIAGKLDLIVCKGKRQEEHLLNPLVKKFWRPFV